jgi:hypothetical protein
MTLLFLAVPGGAVAERPNPGVSLEVPSPAVPMHDVVLGEPGAAAARISASASSQRYSINDGSSATITVSVTPACAETCDVTDPQRVADFIGTLIHGDEVDLLTVQLDSEFQLGFDCGFGAEACYSVAKTRSSSAATKKRTATARPSTSRRPRVRASRRPAPRNAGALRQRSTGGLGRKVEGVRRGQRSGRLYPGDEGTIT